VNKITDILITSVAVNRMKLDFSGNLSLQVWSCDKIKLKDFFAIFTCKHSDGLPMVLLELVWVLYLKYLLKFRDTALSLALLLVVLDKVRSD